jgi:hypothetical protein
MLKHLNRYPYRINCLIILLFILSNISCNCSSINTGNGDVERRNETSEANQLTISAKKIDFSSTNKQIKLIIQLVNTTKPIQLDNITLQSTLIQGLGRGHSLIAYKDNIGNTHPVSAISERLSKFSKRTSLYAGASSLEVEIEIWVSPLDPGLTYQFSLLNHVGKTIDSCEIGW